MAALRRVAVAALLVSLALSAPAARADADELEGDEDEDLISIPDVTPEGPVSFLETFNTASWEERWVYTTEKNYEGKAVVTEAEATTDPGLVIEEPAKHYGMGALVEEPVDLSQGVTLQYEVTLQDGLECGGAYLKYLTADEDLDLLVLKGDTPYSVMFGPDKCGHDTNKVHLIFRHASPLDGEIEEKHMTKSVTVPADTKAHLYTAVIRPDNTYAVAVDNEVKAEGSLFEDFDPPFNPPKEIDDPEDFKPSDWVDEAKISDPDATKPDDWDEDAPVEVEDMEAEKPDGWLDDEPDTVPDPEAEKPDDWDDEEDGDWEAPLVDNPACEEAPGCGEWKRPMKANPDYKGKWYPPKIDNPAYKGPWAPRRISNPRYVVDDTPLAHVGKIGGVALEVWTMSAGIVFDNLLITPSEETAEAYGDATWQVKYTKQAAFEAEGQPKPKEYKEPFLVPQMKALLDHPALEEFQEALKPAVEWLEVNPLALYALLLAVPAVLGVGLSFCCGGAGPAPAAAPAAHPKKTDAATEDDAGGSGGAAAGEEDEDEDESK
eukprot:CAMPEP_0183796224 /NCGR_PEP_ID=MMETSP0803_2-20130417/9091_1 /TAXON_ID=195967 /ORGANISM="Crustomastix stigmata, Strain CCMP3273" /LENGTH=546 /DNA_ID=CAMNT_0026040843 /DNA_START=1 /DNA_END=1638 /DNA_ORIENTATION=+